RRGRRQAAQPPGVLVRPHGGDARAWRRPAHGEIDAMVARAHDPHLFSRYSDEELVRLAPHSPGAAEALFLRPLPGVRRRTSRWAHRYGLPAHAADAQQDAVFALHAAIQHYRPPPAGEPPRSFATYLSRLLRNRFWDFCRSLWRTERRREHALAAE